VEEEGELYSRFRHRILLSVQIPLQRDLAEIRDCHCDLSRERMYGIRDGRGPLIGHHGRIATLVEVGTDTVVVDAVVDKVGIL
jgi:hypothetical protein